MDLVEGRLNPTLGNINEKIGDMINYLILLEAVLKEPIPQIAEETDVKNSIDFINKYNDKSTKKFFDMEGTLPSCDASDAEPQKAESPFARAYAQAVTPNGK